MVWPKLFGVEVFKADFGFTPFAGSKLAAVFDTAASVVAEVPASGTDEVDCDS